MSDSSIPFDCTKQPWGIRGHIVHGHGRGGTMLGFPTANIEVSDAVSPPNVSTPTEGTTASAPITSSPCATEKLLEEGVNHVFFGWGVVEPCLEEVFPVVMSVGYNPHFKDVHKLAIEAHYLHTFDKDFYGSHVRIAVLGDIRVMGAFTTLEALIEVIQSDCDVATERLKTLEKWKACAFLKAVNNTSVMEDANGPQIVAPLSL